MSRIAAVSLDVHGTLLLLAEPVSFTYAQAAGEDVDEVAARLRRAWDLPKPAPGGWRGYWRRVVTMAIGRDDPDVFQRLWAHYARPEAWQVAPGAPAAVDRLRRTGVPVGITSNADARLRPLLSELGWLQRLDAFVISDEIGIAKPDPRIFAHTAAALGVANGALVHLGDSRSEDVAGARAAGCHAWHFTTDLPHFDELADRVQATGTPS